MKLNKPELRVLEFLIAQRDTVTLSQISIQLKIKKSNASTYIKKLEIYRLVTVSKVGRTKQITGSYTHFLRFSKAKERLPHLRLEDILTGKRPNLLAYLDWYSEQKPIGFRIKDINLPEITIRRLFAKFSSLGIIYQRSKALYSVREEARGLLRFCSEILTEIYVAEAERELKGIIGVRISFENSEKAECIFITEKENSPKNYWTTAYSALGEYGIKLISSGKYYYTNIKPKITDVVIHMLAVYKDARSIMYVCALLIKNTFDYHKLFRKESHFGISDKFISNLIEFIETKGQKTPEGFPAWEEVESMVRDYRTVRAVAHG